jgi:hypothetical protein
MTSTNMTSTNILRSAKIENGKIVEHQDVENAMLYSPNIGFNTKYLSSFFQPT